MSTNACPEFDRALARGEEALPVLAEHAASCAECRGRLELWNVIPAVSATLKKSWDTPDLFARIQGAVSEGSRSGSRVAATPGKAPSGRFFWIPAAAAATLFILSMIGLSVFKPSDAGRDPLSTLRVPREPLMTDKTLQDVEGAEARYLESIEKLSRLALPRFDAPATPLLAAYREKLQLLDSAIAETRTQIEQNRFNTHLRRELLAMYQEKQRTLQQLMKEAQS